MGLGKAHDPKELHLIAEESNGTYSSITEDLNSKILEAFAVCLAGLKSVVAVETCITVKTSSTIATVNIKSIDWGSSCKRGSSNVVLELGVLYAGEVKDLMVHIDFTVPEMKGFRSIDLLTATVNYKDVQRMEPQKTECPLKVNICATSFAEDCRHESTPFPMVMHQRARSNVLKFFIDQFKAELELLKVGRTGPKAVGKLHMLWEKFKANDSDWQKAQEIGDDYLLERIDDDINAMVSCLTRGSGPGCVYSWMLSYEKQRAAFTGLPAATFLTPAMKEMVQEAQDQAAATEVDATTSSAVAAGSTHLAPPGTRLVEALEEIVMGVLERSGGGGAVPSPNSAGTATYAPPSIGQF
ncbi:hypothetical protein BAE44_0015666 [Dichanthelium oligosanthes]|uniref:Uncharacterized protein n=1 Tax=Dichanthelium oligosanthes TaxID=888268 RepID=A0A1E5VE40_9POAL|nr:hypothetical protein BAE44_0015666 [Dichanthelium oligosanthes]